MFLLWGGSGDRDGYPLCEERWLHAQLLLLKMQKEHAEFEEKPKKAEVDCEV
jgi:hypothetical protein